MLAPMEGVSHPAFRAMMAERGGLGIVCTEFVRISRAPFSARGIARFVVKAPGVPLSVQVMGNDTGKMAEAAGAVAAAGADVVDVNVGCPSSRAVRSGAGAALLKDPGRLGEVLAAMRARVPGLLSAKIRAGFDDVDAVRIGRTVQEAGADFIVVHPRRYRDHFEGVADWGLIRDLKRALDIPVAGNGDCWYAADALRMHDETGCDAVMIGRPALRNPWIFSQIASLRRGETPPHPSGRDLFDFLCDVAQRYRTAFPKARKGPVGKIKELIAYLGRAVDDQGSFRRAALRLGSLGEILDFASDVLAPMPPDRLDLDWRGTLGLEHSGR